MGVTDQNTMCSCLLSIHNSTSVSEGAQMAQLAVVGQPASLSK